MHVGLLQLTSAPDVATNLAKVEIAAQQLNQTKTSSQPSLLVLPECFAYFGGKDNQQLKIAEPIDNGPIQSQLAAIAKRYQLFLVAGTIPVQASETQFFASCLLFGPTGERLAQYNKIHLFDVTVADNTGSYQESRTTAAGQDVVVVDIGFAKLGLAVCYDLRFPELFRQMQELGADMICLPSAFTKKTGQAHWHVLTRARAIENQCFVLAANQVGIHDNGRQTFGHSLIIDGWGEVIADAKQSNGLLQASIDLQSLSTLRQKMPNLAHRKFKVTD